MRSKRGSKSKGGLSTRPTRADRPSASAKAPSSSSSTVTTATTSGPTTEPGSLFSTPLKLSDGDPKSLTVQEINQITIQVAEFMMDRGFPSFRFNETLNGLRSALTDQFEFIGIELPERDKFYEHPQWWKLRAYTVAQDAIERNKK